MNVLSFIHHTADLPPRNADQLVVQEERYRTIRELLVEVGYKGPVDFVTNRDLKSEPPSDQDGIEYAQGQYVMVPWIVLRNGRAASGPAIHGSITLRYRRFLGHRTERSSAQSHPVSRHRPRPHSLSKETAVTTVSLVTSTIGFCLACVFGYAITTYLASALPRHLRWALAPGVGFGFCSLIFVLFRRPMFTVESAVAPSALWYLLRRKRESGEPSRTPRPSAIALILAAAMVLAAAGLMERIGRIPHGEWDGWAIWDTHARLLFRNGSNWKDDIKYTFHPDYPLLTPSVTARSWRFAGQEIPEAGALAGVVLALSGVAVLASTVARLRGNFERRSAGHDPCEHAVISSARQLTIR